jgi:hypothetical protein
VRDLTESLPIGGEAYHDTVVLTDTREESDETALIALTLVKNKRTGDGEVQVRGSALATGREPSGMNFVPIYLGHCLVTAPTPTFAGA